MSPQLPPSFAIVSSSSPLSSSSPGLLALSDELLLLVFCHLDARCLLVLGSVHRELRDAAAHPASWQHSHYSALCLDDFMRGLPQLSQLHSLGFGQQCALQLTDELLHCILLHLPLLADVDLSHCPGLSNRAFVSLSRLLSRELQRIVFPRQSQRHLDSVAVALTALRHVSLQSVSLPECEWLGRDCLLHLSQLHRLERLELSCMQQLTDASFAFLHCGKLWQRLASLALLRCLRLTDATLGCLSHLPSLASLDVTGCCQLGSGGVRLLSSASSACRHSLQKLSMDECCGVNGDSAALFLLFPALSSLSLNSCPKLTAASLSELAAHPCLRSLRCGDWADEGGSLAAAQGMQRLMQVPAPSLTSLSLSGWQLSPEALTEACSGSAVRLQHLGLAAVDGPQSLSFLQQPTFSSLTSLVLSGLQLTPWVTRFGDAWAAGAAADRLPLLLPALLSLAVRGCRGAASLLCLLDAPLRSLDVSYCPEFGPLALDSIAAMFPQLTALHAQALPMPRSALLRLSQLGHLELLNLDSSPLPLSSLQIFARPAAFPRLGSLYVSAAAAGVAVSRWLRRVRACHVGVLVQVEEAVDQQQREEGSNEDEGDADNDLQHDAADAMLSV